MAYKEVLRVEISDVIRRWRAGHSQRRIANGTGLSRDSVARYITGAEALGVSRQGAEPSEEQLSRLAAIGQPGPKQVEAPSEELLAPWADQIHRWLTGERLQLTRIQELLGERDCRVSYASLQRFVARRNWRRRTKATVRMEDTVPGEVVEVDFGRLGLIHDPETGRRRAVWALLLVLVYSRHCFVWPTFGQTLEDVIAGLESAWAFFGGIPQYLVIDNCPPVVATADPLHLVFTRCLLEYSQQRGFIAHAARARHPKDKPKVERGVPYARERFFKGGEFSGLADVRSRRSAGAAMSLGCASTAPLAGSRWWSSRTRSARPCSLGTARPTRSPTGARPRSTRIITSSAVRLCTRCRPASVRRVRRWRRGWTASWCGYTTEVS